NVRGLHEEIGRGVDVDDVGLAAVAGNDVDGAKLQAERRYEDGELCQHAFNPRARLGGYAVSIIHESAVEAATFDVGGKLLDPIAIDALDQDQAILPDDGAMPPVLVVRDVAFDTKRGIVPQLRRHGVGAHDFVGRRAADVASEMHAHPLQLWQRQLPFG